MSQYPLKSRRIQDAIEAGYSFVFTKLHLYVYYDNKLIHNTQLSTVKEYLQKETYTYNLYLNIIHSKSRYRTIAGIIAHKFYKSILFDYVMNTAIDNYFKPKF